MNLEPRYLVLKFKDVQKYLTKTETSILYEICAKIGIGRTGEDKASLRGIFIEKDWPEYEPTLELLSKRVDNE